MSREHVNLHLNGFTQKLELMTYLTIFKILSIKKNSQEKICIENMKNHRVCHGF